MVPPNSCSLGNLEFIVSFFFFFFLLLLFLISRKFESMKGKIVVKKLIFLNVIMSCGPIASSQRNLEGSF